MVSLTATALRPSLYSRPKVAVLAHEAREVDLRRLGLLHRRSLARLEIVTTQRLSGMLSLAGLTPACHCPDNGGAEVLRAIVERQLDALIFLPEADQNRRSINPRGLLTVCELNGVPSATDVITAGILLTHLSGIEPGRAISQK